MQAARMGEMKNAYKIVVESAERKRLFDMPGRRYDNIKIELKYDDNVD
jgi:hypothetical protein